MNQRLSTCLLIGMLGCAVDVVSDDEQGVSEEELRKECVLGSTCPPAIRVATAKSYVDRRPAARLRTDLEVDSADGDKAPRWFSRTTTRLLRVAENTSVVLSGDADGTKGFTVDDFLLFETIDAATGAVLDAGFVGNDTNVKKDGVALKRLAPPAAWAGANEGFPFAANTVDVGPLLPRDRAFRLRVSGLDFAGVALVSDVFIRAVPTPPPVTDPFDPASCDEPNLTREEAVGLFAPGSTRARLATLQWAARKQNCNPVTGCGSWETNVRAAPFTITAPENSSYPSYHTINVGLPLAATVDLEVSGTNIAFVMKTDSVSYSLGGLSQYDPFVTRCDFVSVKPRGCGLTIVDDYNVNVGYRRVGLGPAEQGMNELWLPVFRGVIGRHCARLTQSKTVQGTKYELVAFGRY